MSTNTRSERLSSLRRWSLPGLALLFAVVGFVAFVARPAFPQPVPDVGSWIPSVDGGPDWDRLYLSKAIVAVMRPTLLVLLVATPVGRRLLRSATGWMSATVVGAALAAVNLVVVVDLATLPVAWWGRLSGLRTVGWMAEWFVVRAQTWALIGLLAAGVTFAIRRWPESWHWRSAIAVGALALVIPLLADLDPFADELRPLPDGPTRQAVESAAAQAGATEVPLREGVGLAATEAGAYVSGLGPSRSIVLSSSLLQQFSPHQIAFVAMHEFAHREHLDVYRRVLGTGTALVAGFWILRFVLVSGPVRRQVEEARAPEARQMIVAVVVAAVVYTVAAPISNLASRRAEAAADWRALEVTADPQSSIAIQRFVIARGGADPDPPGWYQTWLATHPTAAERIGLAVRYAELHAIDLEP